MKQIKILKQETNKSCGVACLRSMLNYYGNDYSEKDVWGKHKSFGEGENIQNPILSLGLTALKFGFNVKYVGYNPIISNNNSIPLDLKESLIIKSKNYVSFGKFYVDTALDFLKLGGEIIIEKLNVEKLKKIIDKDKFFLVEIKPASIDKSSSLSMNHKVIVVGYNQKGFKVLNPSNCEEWLWTFDDFLLAFYSAVPEILIIKPKLKNKK